MREQIRIRTGMKIPLFQEGKTGPSLWSASDWNLLVRAANALLNKKIVRGTGDNVVITDEGWTLNLGVNSIGQ